MPIISPKIPSGLEELMKGLAKSVIKENPQNIYEFAAEYFENLLKKRDGPVDQSYKDFATYKVYRKNKSERFMIEKENLNDVIAYKRNLNSVNYDDSNVIQNKTKSTEEGIIVESNHSIQSTHKSFKTDTQESENNESIKKEKSIEVHSEAKTHVNDDIKNIVLDNDMEQAALKIQSTFREFKGRKEKRRKTLEGGKIGDKDEVDDETDDQGNDFNGSNFKIVEVEKEENPKIEKENLLNEGKSEADDVSKMIFDDDMEQAALKIQSTFRGENLGHKNSICNLQQANTKEFEIQERSYEDNSIAIQKSVDLETEAIKTLTEEEYKPEHDENTFQTNFLLEQQLQGNDKNSVVEVTEETFMEKNVSDTSALPDKNDMETKAETLNDIELLNITSEVPAVETVKQSSIDETVVVEDQKEVKALNIDSVKDKLEQAFNEVHDFFEAEKVTQTLNTHSRKEKIVQGLDEIESSIQDEKVAKTLKTKSEQYEAEQILEKVECFIEAEKVTETQHDFQKADVSVEVGKVTENIDTLQEINEAERTLTQVEESLETEEAPKTLNVQGDKDEIKQSLDKVNSSFEIEKNAETLHISPEQDLDEVNKSVAAEKYTETMNTQSKENNVAAHIEQETTHKSKNSSIKSFPDLECTIIKSSTESQELSKNLNISESLIDNLNSEAFINNQINNISENFDVVSSQDATIVDPEKSLESFDAENISIFATNISDSTNFPIEIQDSKIISDKVETSSEINGTEKVNIDEFIELENVISEDVKNKSYDENLLLINDNITTKETQNYSSKNKKEKLNVKDEFPVETFTVETKASEVIKLHDNVHSIGVSKNLEDNIDSNDIKKVDQTANVIIQENTDELQTNNKANAGDVKIDDVPVNEPICKKKLISLLEPDQDDDDEKKTITDKDNEILSNEIKYAKLEESLSGADIITGESFDEGDYYSQLINNESSTNEEASHLNQQSYDEASHKDTVLVTSSPDDEKNDINFIKDSNADQRIQTTSNEIQTYISEINVIKENVKDAIDVIASDNSNVIQKDIISQKEIINDHVFEPKLIVENPISEITASELIDLNKEIVNVNRDELEAIKDEILQPESEQSEIPDEKTNAPEDENVPIISMDEKSLPTENEKNVSPENEFNVKVDEPKVEDDVNDMIINENMENTTLKIEEDFSVHKVDNDILKQYSESEKDSEQHNKEIEAIRTV
ncbi:CLUMA_CG012684, isoform A, partial [Clunio marinus]